MKCYECGKEVDRYSLVTIMGEMRCLCDKCYEWWEKFVRKMMEE